MTFARRLINNCFYSNFKSIFLCFFTANIRFFLLSVFVFAFFDKILLADDLPVGDEIYTIAETNGIATAICKAIDIGIALMTPLFAIMFSVLGLQAFQGKLRWSSIFTFVLAMTAFKGAGAILEFFLPDMGLSYGCKCATSRYVRDQNGQVKEYSTGLTDDCKQIDESDYVIND